MELEREVCVAEALSVVAETMAPFENQLLRLQREKDEVAVQVTAPCPISHGFVDALYISIVTCTLSPSLNNARFNLTLN